MFLFFVEISFGFCQKLMISFRRDNKPRGSCLHAAGMSDWGRVAGSGGGKNGGMSDWGRVAGSGGGKNGVSAVTSVSATSTKPPASILPNVDNLREGILQGSAGHLAMIGAFSQMKNQQIIPSWHSPPQVLQVLTVRDNALVELRKKYEKAEKERDELKLTLENFQTSSKNLTLRFVSETLHFVFQDLAFCLDSTAFCEEQFVVFCADCDLFKIFIAPSGEVLRKCILSGPYKPTTVLVQAVDATDDSPTISEHTTAETPKNMSPENKAHFKAEKEAINLILIGIRDEIYLTVDACQTAQEMFVTIVKQQHKLDEVSYHKLLDILKQYQKEVNELRAERLATEVNPLALVYTAQANQDPYYQISKSHKSHAPSSKPSIPTRSHTTTRYKGKEIAKPITPPSEIASKEDNDPEQAHRDKDMQKNLALIAKYFKKIYKPTNNNLKTSSNSRNKNVDMTPRNAESQKGLRTPRITRRRCCCANKLSKEVPTPDSGTDSEPVEQVQNDARYNVFANDLQHSEQSESVSNTCLVETNDRNVIPDSPDMCENDIKNDQNDIESDDERVALANLKLDNKQAEFEKYKAFNDRIVDYEKLERKLNEALGQLAQKDIEIKDGLKTKAYEISVAKEKHEELIKQSLLTKSHYEGLVKQKTKVITDLKLREQHDIDKMFSMEKQLKFLNEIVYKRSQTIQTSNMMAPKAPTYKGRPTFANPRYIKQAQSEIPCLYAFPYGQSTHANRLIPDGEETLALKKESQSKLYKDLVRPYDYTTLNKIVDNAWIKHSKDQFHAATAQDMEILIQTCLMPLAVKTQNDSFLFVHELKQEMHADLKYVKSLEKEVDELESDKAEFSNMYEMIL
nr:hypothetical protein [Tanacetum cinerariifolium]